MRFTSKTQWISGICFLTTIGILGSIICALGNAVGQNADVSTLLLLKTTHGKAVIRFGSGELFVVSVGDRLGRTRAEVKEIDAGRMVLEERFTGEDGKPNRAEIILKEGEAGGRRYLRRLEETPLPAYRPQVILPQSPLP